MGIFSGLFRSRDKPKDSYDSPSYSYFFGRTHAVQPWKALFSIRRSEGGN